MPGLQPAMSPSRAVLVFGLWSRHLAVPNKIFRSTFSAPVFGLRYEMSGCRDTSFGSPGSGYSRLFLPSTSAARQSFGSVLLDWSCNGEYQAQTLSNLHLSQAIWDGIIVMSGLPDEPARLWLTKTMSLLDESWRMVPNILNESRRPPVGIFLGGASTLKRTSNQIFSVRQCERTMYGCT